MALNEQVEDWKAAIELLIEWEVGGRHLDDLLERHNPGKLRWLVIQSFRVRLVVDRILSGRIKRQPRPKVLHILQLAVAELLSRSMDKGPAIVNTAVTIAAQLGASKPEAGFINGVLRSILRQPESLDYSLDETIPGWLLDKWRKDYGTEALALLLEWNSRTPTIFVRADDCPCYAESTDWAGFYAIKEKRFIEALPELKAGKGYIQDPFTRVPIDLLEIQPGENIIDFCAAPGGKSRWILEKLQGRGSLLAVDKPGPRIERLQQNLELVPHANYEVLATDILELETNNISQSMKPGTIDAVLIDVPCSNTGVIQRRPDVQLRLSERDISKQADLQLSLLESASKWPRDGGRLVYSTCSLEQEENAQLVARFLARHPDWALEDSVLSLPWICGHDGGGAFLLTKTRHP